MTDTPDGGDLTAMAQQADAEILAAEQFQVPEAALTDPYVDVSGLGYYEAELKSLRDAATTLDRAERLE